MQGRHPLAIYRKKNHYSLKTYYFTTSNSGKFSMFSKSRKIRGNYPSVTFTTKAIPKSSYRQAAAARSAASRMQARLKPAYSLGRTSRQEVKCFDVTVGSPAGNLVAFSSAASAEPGAAFLGMTELNCVQQGAAFYQRIGTKITIKSIRVSFDIAGVTSPAIDVVRWALVYDRQPNAAFPAIADIFSNNSGTATSYGSVNMVNRSRFQIIRDQEVAIDPAQQQVAHVDSFCKGNWESEFKASGNTIGDIATGSILLIIGVSSVVGAVYPTFSGCQCRIRYYD